MRKIYRNAKSYVCPYCNGEFFGRRDFKKHKSDCAKEHGLGTDSLGRFINPLSGKHAMEAFKKKVEAGLASFAWTDKKHSLATRKMLSEKRIEFLESHPDHGLRWYTVNGIKVQGTWEKKFAEFLTSKGISWTRQKIDFLGTHRYTPDFYCPSENIYFDVKGFRRDRDIYKMHLVLREHPEIQIKMIELEELNHLDEIDIFKLPNFQEKYKFEDIDLSLFNNVWK